MFVHSHNMEFREFDRDYAHAKDYRPVEMLPESERASFMGIVRENGQVATRNYVGVLSTVNCSATVVHKIAEYFTPERLAEYPNVDGVVAFAHGTGCGMEMTGEPMDLLRRTMAGFARHANIAGALIVGLGCERNQISSLLKEQGLDASSRLRSFVMQETGGTRKTIEAGIAAVKEMLPDANRVTRTRVPASHIMVGLQCGGSDGFSSITANPALGAAIDLLVRHGGTGDPFRDAGNLRRRAHAHAPRALARSRREADRAHPLVERRIHRRAATPRSTATSAPATRTAGSRTSSRSRSARR